MAYIERRGDLQWRAQIKRKGYPTQNKTFNTRAEAEAWSRLVESEIDRGAFVVAGRREAEVTTLLEAIDKYKAEITPKKKSRDEESRMIERIKLGHAKVLMPRPLASLRSVDFSKLRDKRLADGVSPSTVRLEFGLLSHLFTVSRKEWGMESLSNPISLIFLPKKSEGRNRRLGIHDQIDNEGKTERKPEFDLILQEAKKFRELPEFFELLLETGMRRSELHSLSKKKVNLNTRVASLKNTKNGKDRDVPLTPRAVEIFGSIFESWPQHDDGRIFSLSKGFISVAFRRIVKKLRIEGLRMHDLRHEATSRFFEMDLGLLEVASITGHQDLQMLKRYTHLRASSLADKLAAAIK